MKRLKSEEESFFFGRSQSQEGKTKGKIERENSIEDAQQSSTAGDGKVRMEEVMMMMKVLLRAGRGLADRVGEGRCR